MPALNGQRSCSHPCPLTSAPVQVNAFAIFIAEASAAQWMRTELPLGSSFVAMDVAKLPMIVKDVFSAATNVD